MGLLYRFDMTIFTVYTVVFVASGIIFFAGLIKVIVLANKKDRKPGEISLCAGKWLAFYITFLLGALIGYGDAHSNLAPLAYEEGVRLYKDWECAAARELFELIPGYMDSDELARECSHNSARYYIEQGEYVEALGQLHGYTSDEEGRGMFKAAEDALIVLNASGGLAGLLDEPGKWVEKNGRYYLTLTEKNGELHCETDIVQSPYHPFLKYKFHFDRGILKAQLIRDENSAAIFQNADDGLTTLRAYCYNIGKVFTFVRQSDR